MGTEFFITLYATNQVVAEQAAESAFRRVNSLETTLSDYQADSELNQLRDQAVGVPIPVSRDLARVLDWSWQVARRSHGAFDPTIGPYVRLWRFSRKRKTLPEASELAQARAAVGWQNLQVDRRGQTVTKLVPNMRLDVGGVAKGVAADEALATLRAHGIRRALVAASGDIALGDPPPGREGWRVAVTGLGSTNASSSYLLARCGISTSGDTEQFIEIGEVRYSHIVDPRTGLGLTRRVQVTVVGPNASTTDPLATAASILGPEEGTRLVRNWGGASARFVTFEDGRRRVFTTPGFPKMLAE